ncbi:MAG TPA: mycofactocin precursor MftA [Acidimicrobiales bacterium]|nr:mycofactocin precursor MftA [Acidimicrobiales bacterium]
MVDTATVDTLRTAEPEEALEDSTDLVEEELLVEEISIDGMCGVY